MVELLLEYSFLLIQEQNIITDTTGNPIFLKIK